VLQIKNISKRYDDFHLQEINLTVETGEYFVLLGPSGAGKTMLFETITGLIKPDKGSIFLNGKEITGQPISHRGVGIVFQDGAVFPHMTVKKNLGYALQSKKHLQFDVGQRIYELADSVGISHLMHRKPATLSGGELQRVAIARTLAQDPLILLLDEPLASLDYQLRQEIRDLLKGLNNNGLTILHITHDYHEAFYLADKLAIIDQGRIIQTGTPEEVILQPGSKFVAGFIGIRNSFSFTNTGENHILLENKVQIPAHCDLAKGIVFIPNDGIRLSHEYKGKEGFTEIPGTVIHKVRFPEAIQVVIDIGIRLHYFSPVGIEPRLRIEPGNELIVVIDIQKLILQEK
jgi:ABC-type sugar transport system ATPase subunit